MKNGHCVLPFVLLMLSFGVLSAQKTITEDEQTWFAAFNQTRLTDRWGFWFDTHLRFREAFIQEPSLFIGRFGPTFYLTDDVRLTAAYAFVNFFPDDSHPNISQIEHRPWQQVQWFTSIRKVRLVQWVRLEERFRRKLDGMGGLADGYDFNWRVRLNGALFVPLGKSGLGPGSLQWTLNDELMLNFGKQIRYNYFDQNRLFTGLVYQTAAASQIQLGYMNVFAQLPAGDRFRNQHTIRLFYFHNFDLRKR